MNNSYAIYLFNAVITAAALRKEVDCRFAAAARAYNTSEEAIDNRQRFAAQALAEEEATASHYAGLVSNDEILTLASSAVEDAGLFLDLAALRLNKAAAGYHALGLPAAPSAVEELAKAYNKAEEAYDRAIANRKAVEAFLANR